MLYIWNFKLKFLFCCGRVDRGLQDVAMAVGGSLADSTAYSTSLFLFELQDVVSSLYYRLSHLSLLLPLHSPSLTPSSQKYSSPPTLSTPTTTSSTKLIPSPRLLLLTRKWPRYTPHNLYITRASISGANWTAFCLGWLISRHI